MKIKILIGLFSLCFYSARSEDNVVKIKENIDKHLTPGADQLNKILSVYTSAKELYESLNTLSKGDCVPEFTTSAEAMIPSFCLDSTTCEQCYKEAYGKLQSARKRLARLKCLGNSTKDFVSKSISFGDQVSGIHAIQGLAWQKEKKVINETYDKFKTTYDTKYKELMDKLTESLQAIDECESTHGQKDWFQRFGFMYVEFMADRYKRAE